jgi:hypothetical protein
MKYIALVVGLFWANLTFAGGAFTYHGISSGMTSDEVNAITGCTKYCSSLDSEEVKKFFSEKEEPPGLMGMGFSYTSGGKLWRIQLEFREASGPAGVAQLRALNELYPDAELQSGRVELFSNYYVDTKSALMIDSALFDADVEAVYQATIGKY